MPPAPRHPEERARLQALDAVTGVDRVGDQFDRIARLVADAFGASMAVVTLLGEHESITIGSVDGSRPVFPRDETACAWTAVADRPFVVEDVRQHEDLADLPIIAKLGTRFYAGAAVRSPGGYPIGAVCVGDTKTRAVQAGDERRLEDFAELVAHLLTAPAGSRELAERDATIERLFNDTFAATVFLEPIRDDEGEVVDFRHTHANDRATEMLKMSREQLCRQPHSQLLPNYYAQGFFNFFVKALESGVPCRTEHPYADDRLDGWYTVSAVAHQCGLIVTFYDVTSARAHGLECSEFFSRSPDLFAVTDPNGVLLRAAGGWRSELSLDPDAIVGHPIWDTFHPDDRERAREVTVAMTHGQVMSGGVFRVRHADGTCRHVSWSAARSPADGRIYAIGRDQTAQHLATEQLRLFIEHTPAAVAVVDRDMRYLAASRRWYEDYGLEGIDIIGHSHYDVFPEIGEDWKAIHRRCLAGSNEWCDADLFERDDGSAQWLRWEIHPWRSADGEIGGIAMFTEDITERKLANDMSVRVNKELKAARDAAEAAGRAKSAFLANMSHELRTPLSAIVGYAELLADEHDPETVALAAGVIESNGRHLLGMVNDVLDLAKVEADRVRIELAECSLPHLIEDVLATCAPRADSQGVRLGFTLGDRAPEDVRTDPGRLRQILLNLVGNAVKFTSAGDVRVRVGVEHSQIAIDVEDTGIGMSPDFVGRLFEPFTQADDSSTRSHAGTGLGLAISRRLARLLGGELVCHRSSPNEGTVMRLRLPNLPVLPRTSAPAPEAPRLPADLACRVLLAEDGPDNARLLIHLLTSAGATVDHAADGREAIDRALGRGSDYDLILMDMQMPELDGYGAAAELRARGYTRPIIALTAHAMPEDRDRCLAAGCDDFLTKPVPRGELVALCHRYATRAERPAA
ncbi:MAG: PAS domain-containing protein [Phycisphaerales bacterium]